MLTGAVTLGIVPARKDSDIDMETRINIPDVLERFVSYYETTEHGEWGSLHIALADGNVTDDNIRSCIERADEWGDAEGKALGEILLKMSKTQRSKLPWAVFDAIKRVRGTILPVTSPAH